MSDVKTRFVRWLMSGEDLEWHDVTNEEEMDPDAVEVYMCGFLYTGIPEDEVAVAIVAVYPDDKFLLVSRMKTENFKIVPLYPDLVDELLNHVREVAKRDVQESTGS